MTARLTSLQRLQPEPVHDGRHFRDVLGHFGSGVVVITALEGGTPVGFSCQSFSSASLDPPLITFLPARTSTSYPKIRRAARFGVNILAAHQHDLSAQMSRSGADKWAGVDWSVSEGGCPIIAGCHAFLECSLEQEFEAGDHFVVLGRVERVATAPESEPLLFHRGAYARLAS